MTVEDRNVPSAACFFGAVLPLMSFIIQYLFSKANGTETSFWAHHPVVILDWVFVPLNWYFIQIIDWRRGLQMFVLSCVALIANIVIHAHWQLCGTDSGHMITSDGVVLLGGWTHLGFSVIEMSLLLGFVLCRRAEHSGTRIATVLACIYFVSLACTSFLMHGRLLVSDAITSSLGLFGVLLLPSALTRTTQNAECASDDPH